LFSAAVETEGPNRADFMGNTSGFAVRIYQSAYHLNPGRLPTADPEFAPLSKQAFIS